MVSPLLLAAAAAALPPPPAALAQIVIAAPAPPPLPIPDETQLALGRADERFTVPVTIGARGPWPFVIDTGAERTVLSRELAGVLGLAAGPPVRVIAMTGPAVVGSVIVPQLSVSPIRSEAIDAPALGAHDLGAAGMLGLDALQGHAVTIDFATGQMTVRPARRRLGEAAAPGEVVVVARSLYGQLIVTDAAWRGKRIAVIVDTGSPLTVGNTALLAAITHKPRPVGPIDALSATGETLHTAAFLVDRLTIGGVGFDRVRVAFADVAPFRRFGLADTPALILGLDTMRLFRRVAIDFTNREIRFVLPKAAVDGVEVKPFGGS